MEPFRSLTRDLEAEDCALQPTTGGDAAFAGATATGRRQPKLRTALWEGDALPAESGEEVGPEIAAERPDPVGTGRGHDASTGSCSAAWDELKSAESGFHLPSLRKDPESEDRPPS